MHVLQNFGTDNSMQVGLHKIEHQINVFIILGSDQVLQTNNVRVPVQLS